MKKRLLKIALSICSLVCFAIAGIGMAFDFNGYDSAQAYEITLDNADALQEEYGYGYVLTVPSGTIEGVRASRFVVVSPTGAMYSTPSIALSESGVYTIIWYANVGGKEVAAEKSFTVKKSAFDMTGSASVDYMEQLERVTDREASGIKVKLASESSVTCNRAIDLVDSSVPFIKIYPYQGILNLENAMNGVEDYQFNIEARNICLTLTDCYDPSNYVIIDLEWAAYKDSNRTYWNFRAGAVGQTAHGLRNAVKEGYSTCYVDDTQMIYMLAPAQGATACNVTDNYGIEFFYDTTLNRIYATNYRYAKGEYTKYRNRDIIADLSNLDIYGKKAFKGFKGTEVYLTISAKNFISTSVSMEIETLGGLSGGDILNASMNDTKDPIIEVPEVLKSNSAISIANGEGIDIPDAIVYDVSLPYGTKANKTVYYGYNPGSSNNVVQPLSNGKLTPTKTGVYSILYTATDAGGNVGTARVDLACQAAANNKAVTLSVPSQINASAGTNVAVPACSITGLYTDESHLTKYVSFDGGEKQPLTSDSIYLNGVGNYVITYEYETPFKTYTATCTIASAPSNNILIEKPALPNYFIKGANYTLDAAYAYEYKSAAPAKFTADTYMSSDGGAYTEVTADAVNITASNTVKFKYVHGTATEYSDTVSVVDVGFTGTLRMKDYFHTASGTVTSSASYDGLQYAMTGTEDVTFEYVNTLALSLFSMEFNFLTTGGAKMPGTFTVTLTDYYDRENSASVSISGANILLNGDKVAAFEEQLLDQRLTLGYGGGGFKFNGTLYPYDCGFTSDRVLLKVEFGNMENNVCWNLAKLCGRMMSDSDYDDLKPALSTTKLHTGYQPMNRVITITTATATDVIAPYVKSGLRLSVRKPNGTFATSVDGVLLDGSCSTDREYNLKLDTIGSYTVLYEYTDQNGGRNTLSYRPIIRDEAAPTLSVSGVKDNGTIKAAYGSTVNVASYSVSDNVSSGATLYSNISVCSPSGFLSTVQGGKFYASEKGNYYVIYFTYDEIGNCSTFTYVVKVA